MEPKIRTARKAAGLSKRALAVKAGVSEAVVRKWELNGTSNARAGHLAKAAKALGVSVESIID